MGSRGREVLTHRDGLVGEPAGAIEEENAFGVFGDLFAVGVNRADHAVAVFGGGVGEGFATGEREERNREGHQTENRLH